MSFPRPHLSIFWLALLCDYYVLPDSANIEATVNNLGLELKVINLEVNLAESG